MAYLLAVSGPHSGRIYELRGAEALLGRHPACDVVIDQGAVSRRHAQITFVGGEFYVEDKKSRNGTYLNEQPVVGRRMLSEGDQIRVCNVSFVFHRELPTEPHEPDPLEGSGFAAVLVDDGDKPQSTIMSTLDVSSSHGVLPLAASAEAKLEALLEITHNLSGALSLDEVLPKVLKTLFKIFVQADRGFIVLQNSDGTLIPRWTEVRRGQPEERIRISRVVARQVMESRQAILSADATEDSRFELSESIANYAIRSMMCAPLLDREGNAIGVLQTDTLDQRKRFRQEDLALLASIAAQASIAIDNAHLHERALTQRALERDLELAHQVQKGFLPLAPPDIPGYEFFDYYEPANRVGGDYYDYVPLPDGRVAIIVADVVGHGVAAALLMAKLSAEIRYFLASQPDPAIAITRLNDVFCNLHVDDRFVTLVMVVLDPRTHEVLVVNAGHMAPIMRSADGRLSEPGSDCAGLPIGVIDGVEYRAHPFCIQPGDTLVMYTDGVNETMNSDGQLYGIERIREHVVGRPQAPAKLGDQIIGDVNDYLGEAAQTDDTCLVCFGRIA